MSNPSSHRTVAITAFALGFVAALAASRLGLFGGTAQPRPARVPRRGELPGEIVLREGEIQPEPPAGVGAAFGRSALGSRRGESGARAAAGTAFAEPGLLDLNSAGRLELVRLPGIGETYARKIVRGRPYARVQDLVRRHILPAATFRRIERLIFV